MEQDRVIVETSADVPGISAGPVTAWLGANTPVAPPVEFALIAAGGSNLTYRLTDADGKLWVLRRPPEGDLLESAHDVAREHRILDGLGATRVPVPRVHGLCTDHDVTGGSFFVMEFVDGPILRSTQLGERLGPERARAAGIEFYNTLAELHVQDLSASGLDRLSRPDRYVERQLKRWHGQYATTAGADASPVEAELHGRLRELDPGDVADDGAHLVHGDYHIDNAVFDDRMNVIALLDWELATLGHPIADLAWALMFWAEPSDDDPFLEDSAMLAPGFITRDEASRVYADASGYSLESLPYFEAFSLWKMACLLSGSVYRARRGSGGGLQAARTERSSLDEQVARIDRLFARASDVLANT